MDSERLERRAAYEQAEAVKRQNENDSPTSEQISLTISEVQRVDRQKAESSTRHRYEEMRQGCTCFAEEHLTCQRKKEERKDGGSGEEQMT